MLHLLRQLSSQPSREFTKSISISIRSIRDHHRAAHWSPPPPPPPMIEHIGGQVAQLTGRRQVLLRIIRRTTTARAGIELLAIDTFPRNVVDDGFASSPKINMLRCRRLVCSTTPVLSRCASASARTRG